MTSRKPFEQLTARGQARRLRQLALAALQYYDLPGADVTLLGRFTNALFRVRTAAGQTYVLRLCSPGWRTESDIRSEIAWLNALAEETDIGAPRPIAARDGAFLVEASVPGAATRCMLMTWVPGRRLGRYLTQANLTKMGRLFARLHDFSSRFVPPPDFTTRKMDRVLARDEPDALWGGAAIWDGVDSAARTVIEQVKQRVDDAYRDLYASPGLCVIHHDLWHDNIHLHAGRLYPLDFEDTVWGYPVQDIAMALQDLMDDTSPDAFEPLQLAFRRGYESLLPWPETNPGQIDTFRAGRMLWVTNWIARHQPEHTQAHLAWLAKPFARFLATGILRKLPPS
ncbi:MAG: phosphotransferase enzyme family protein [Chloroflexota bacterium]